MNSDRIFKRRLLVWSAWGLILSAGLAALFGWHSLRLYEESIRRFEEAIGSANHRDYAGASVPAEKNTVAALRSALSGIEPDGWFQIPPPEAWTPDVEIQVRELLASHAESLAALESAVGLPSCSWPATAPVDSVHTKAALAGAQLLRLEGFVGVFDRDEPRITSTLRVLGALVECLYAQPHLAGAMVAAAVERSRLEVVQAVVSSADTGDALLDMLAAEIARSSQHDRIRWAIAAEGALALRLLDEGRPGQDRPKKGLLRSVLSKRLATAMATRWLELQAWSERPLEKMSSEPRLATEPALPAAEMVADILIPNLRPGLSSLKLNESLIDLAQVAIEARRHGSRSGGYATFFDDQPQIMLLTESDGAAVVVDRKLESLLRTDPRALGAGDARNLESILDLVVWRLPPPGLN